MLPAELWRWRPGLSLLNDGLSEYLDFFMQNLLRIDYENILLKTSVNLWGDYPNDGDMA